MIAGKQKLVAVKKDDVTARVSGGRNHQQIVIKLHPLFASDDTLNTETSRAVVCVHDPFAVEAFTKQLVGGDVVFVCEQHFTDAAHRFNPFHELACKPRRVDQDVATFARGPRNQIAPRAEARLSGEAAEVNIVFKQHRKRIDAEVRVVLFSRADRSGGTRNQRHHGELRFRVCFGLAMDAALFAMIAKDSGRELAARLAVDAGRVNKEIPRHILR